MKQLLKYIFFLIIGCLWSFVCTVGIWVFLDINYSDYWILLSTIFLPFGILGVLNEVFGLETYIGTNFIFLVLTLAFSGFLSVVIVYHLVKIFKYLVMKPKKRNKATLKRTKTI